MWTYKILLADYVGVSPRVIVSFTDGVQVLEARYVNGGVPTDDWLKRQISGTLTTLEASTAFFAGLTPDAPLPDLTPTPLEPPTKEQAEKSAYFKETQILAQLKLVFKPGEPELDAQEAVVKALYKPEYYQ